MGNKEDRIEGVIFDMDGLLLDTERIVKRTWTDVGTAMGYPDMGEQIYHTLGFSRPRRKAYFESYYGPGWPDEEIVRRCGIRFNEIVDTEGIPVKKGVRELMGFLKEKGIKIGLATSTSEEYARLELEHAGLWEYFDGRVFGSMIKKSKPAPEIYEKACAAIGVEPGYALALEDAPSGVQSAHAAGLRAIMIPDLVQPTAEIKAMTWDVKDSLLDVIEIIKSYI